VNSTFAQHRVVLQPPRVAARAVVLLVMVFASIGGCQTRREPTSEPARILYDSLLVSYEARFDSATANLAYDRIGCLYVRARSSVGVDTAKRMLREAEQEIRARRSSTELAAAERGMQMTHPFWTPEVCRRIDSLWYVGFATRHKTRPD